MSHFLFGDFATCICDALLTEELRRKLQTIGVLVYIDEEINFCADIQTILREHPCHNHRQFFLTTVKQRYNSDDLLFPYDKYSNEELFPAGNDRETFNKVCLKNLKTLEDALTMIVDVYEAYNLRVFIVDGYDNEFEVQACSLQQMMDNIVHQVQQSFSLASTIYKVD